MRFWSILPESKSTPATLFNTWPLAFVHLSASVGLVEVVLKKEKEEKKIARNTAIAP